MKPLDSQTDKGKSLHEMVGELPDEQEAREEMERNAAEMRRLRAYRTLVLTTVTLAVGFYIAGEIYTLVRI